MVDKAFVKKWPDGREVVVAQLTDTHAHVRIGGEYCKLPIQEWRDLPLNNEGDKIAQ